MPDNKYHEMYDRLIAEFIALHQANQVRIHKGLIGMLVILALFLTLLFVTQGSKVIILLMWIISMFAIAAYLIAVEYLNHELEKKLGHITQMEHDFGPVGADVVAEENILKLREIISAAPSLVDAISSGLSGEAAHSAAAPDDAPAAEADAAAPDDAPEADAAAAPDAGEESTQADSAAAPDAETPDAEAAPVSAEAAPDAPAAPADEAAPGERTEVCV